MQHILVHSKMNGLRALLTAPPVFAFRQLRGDSKKCCRLLQAIFENHHEPIIDLQTWERVQELRKQRKRPNRYDDVGLFSGLLFCADCGHVMYQQRYQTDKRKQDCYICGSQAA